MDSGFCVKKCLVVLLKKGLFGGAIIKKRRYWTENINGDAIDSHFVSNDVVIVDTVKQVVDGVAYHVFCTKQPDYVIKTMTTYGKLESTDKSTRRKIKCSGVMETKEFMYTEAVANIFLY